MIMAGEYVLSDVKLYDFTRPFASARMEDPHAEVTSQKQG